MLVEADYFPLLNELWEINASKETRIERLMSSRNYSLEKCESIIGSQHDTAFYEDADLRYKNAAERNDYFGFKVIDNNSDIENLYRQIDLAMEETNGRIG